VLATPFGDVRASVVEAVRFSATCIAGVGSGVRLHDLPASWSQSLVALRLASWIAPVVRWDDLGAVALLASVPAEEARTHPDVQAVREAGAEPWGLDTLEAVARTDSSRAASAILGLHHSTVQSRATRLEDLLGFRLGTAEGRTRAMVALALYRLTRHQP
jgi:sugar diacid utilization regulator